MLDTSDKFSSVPASIHPLISVGLPVVNCERTLKTPIRSILQQTYRNLELLLLCDKSTDHTLEVARSFLDPRIRVIADGLNLGLPARLNQGIEIGSGKCFARMDSNDGRFDF